MSSEAKRKRHRLATEMHSGWRFYVPRRDWRQGLAWRWCCGCHLITSKGASTVAASMASGLYSVPASTL